MKEKNTPDAPWSDEGVCFQMLDLETSNSKSEVTKSNSLKVTSFSQTTLLQRELFLTMLNSSPLLYQESCCILSTLIVSSSFKDEGRWFKPHGLYGALTMDVV